MAQEYVMSSASFSNFESCLSELDRHCAALHLLWLELARPRLHEKWTDAVCGLMQDRLDLLDQTLWDFHTFRSAVSSGHDFR